MLRLTADQLIAFSFSRERGVMVSGQKPPAAVYVGQKWLLGGVVGGGGTDKRKYLRVKHCLGSLPGVYRISPRFRFNLNCQSTALLVLGLGWAVTRKETLYLRNLPQQ